MNFNEKMNMLQMSGGQHLDKVAAAPCLKQEIVIASDYHVILPKKRLFNADSAH